MPFPTLKLSLVHKGLGSIFENSLISILAFSFDKIKEWVEKEKLSFSLGTSNGYDLSFYGSFHVVLTWSLQNNKITTVRCIKSWYVYFIGKIFCRIETNTISPEVLIVWALQKVILS